jgi:hypothetical protein
VTVFGRVVTGYQVEQAVIETLNALAARLPARARAADRPGGRPGRAPGRPRSWTTPNEFQHWPEEQLPAGVVISTGLAEQPRSDGVTIGAAWTIGVAVVVSAPDRMRVDELAKLYSAAVRSILLHKGSLGGFAAGFVLDDESYDDVPDAQGRTLGAGQVIGRVLVDDVNATRGGPASPSAAPEVAPPDWPVVPDRAHVIPSITIETGANA